MQNAFVHDNYPIITTKIVVILFHIFLTVCYMSYTCRDMNENDKVPELKPVEPKRQTPVSDPSFTAPPVRDYTNGANAPEKDPVKKYSMRDKIKKIREDISQSPFKGFFSVVQLVIGSILLALFINHFIFQSYQVYGLSMTPTLHNGDRLIVSKVEKSLSNLTNGNYIPDRGDIIVFRNPLNVESPQLIKRVIGLPGERVVVNQGNIFIFNSDNPNGFMPDKSFGLELDITVGNVDLVVPDGNIFVAGDNRVRGGSLDSRNELGTVPVNLIVGELLVRILPASDIKIF